jgi:glucosylglycerate synthase
MHLETVSERTREQLASVGSADLVIGLTDCPDGEALKRALEQIELTFAASEKAPRTVVFYPDTVGELGNGNGNGNGNGHSTAGNGNGGAQPVAVAAAEIGSDGDIATEVASSLPTAHAAASASAKQTIAIPLPFWPSERLPEGAPADTQAVLTLAALGQTVGASVVVLWASPATSLPPAALLSFGEAIGGEGFDLAMPGYLPQKFGGLLNSGLLAPFVRTLYGQRVAYPMALDIAMSPRFCELLLRPDPRTEAPQLPHWISTLAACNGMKICQAELSLPAPQSRLPSDDLSTMLALVLGSLFQDAERNASFWHRTRGSQPVRRFGTNAPVPLDTQSVDVQPMIEGFALAYNNLSEVWTPVLPPATLLELKKLSRTSQAEFRLSDATWARVVFDFLLAQRQRVMTRDHLLRAFTPIYLAWVASYLMQVERASPAQAAARLEQLAKAFEAQRPYLLSRWRWPDRFNP